MSWLKVFGSKSSSKSSSKDANKNKQSANRRPEPSDYGLTPEELAEAERTLPVLAGRENRLSVSKSGRHKYKGKQRNHLQDDTYATHGSVGSTRPSVMTSASTSNSRQAPSYHPAGASTSYNSTSSASSRHHNATSSPSTQGARASQGSVGRNSQQGSLGRSGSSQCAVVQTSTDTKRYNARAGKNMPRQQTAV